MVNFTFKGEILAILHFRKQEGTLLWGQHYPSTNLKKNKNKNISSIESSKPITLLRVLKGLNKMLAIWIQWCIKEYTVDLQVLYQHYMVMGFSQECKVGTICENHLWVVVVTIVTKLRSKNHIILSIGRVKAFY